VLIPVRRTIFKAFRLNIQAKEVYICDV